jgi:hypothetical protein
MSCQIHLHPSLQVEKCLYSQGKSSKKKACPPLAHAASNSVIHHDSAENVMQGYAPMHGRLLLAFVRDKRPNLMFCLCLFRASLRKPHTPEKICMKHN